MIRLMITDALVPKSSLSLLSPMIDTRIHEFDIELQVVDQNGIQNMLLLILSRNGNYKYTYHDDKTTAEIKQKFQEFMQFTQQFVSTGIVNEEPNISEKGSGNMRI